MRLTCAALLGTLLLCSLSLPALAETGAAAAQAPQQPVPASSQEAAPKPFEPKSHDKYYLSLELGQSTLPQNGCSVSNSSFAGATLSNCSDRSSALRVGAGYAFSHFGVELSYTDYGSSQLGMLNIPGRLPINAGRREMKGFELTTGAFYPRDNRKGLIKFNFGLAYTMVNMPDLGMNTSSIGLTLGAVFQYKLTQHMDLRAQYKLVSFRDPLGQNGLIQLVTAGTVYYF